MKAISEEENGALTPTTTESLTVTRQLLSGGRTLFFSFSPLKKLLFLLTSVLIFCIIVLLSLSLSLSLSLLLFLLSILDFDHFIAMDDFLMTYQYHQHATSMLPSSQLQPQIQMFPLQQRLDIIVSCCLGFFFSFLFFLC